MSLKNPEYIQKATELMKKMTLEEKVGQLNQLRGNFSTGLEDGRSINLESEVRAGHVGTVLNLSPIDDKIRVQKLAVEESRFGIPLMYAFDIIHGLRTLFPIPLAQSASWDLEAIEHSERIAAIEAAAAGFHWTFAPMVDVCRDPRWGRVMEGAGEDTYLGCRIAEARVRGFQGDDLSRLDTIMACAKHYAVYGAAEGGREYNTVDVSDIDLREVYLPPFKACVDAGAASFMTSFNTINRMPASCNTFLLRTILRDEWEYPGIVISDYNSLYEIINHGVAADKREAAMRCIRAGCDIDMMGRVYIDELEQLVKEGVVEEALIDEAVVRIIVCKYALGLFDDPFRYFDQKKADTILMKKEHLDFARDFARKTIVLLKNESQLLPLQKDANTIGIIGPLADTVEKGTLRGNWPAWSSAEDTVTPLEGIRAAVGESTRVEYAQGGAFEGYCSEKDIADAVAVAQKVDVVVLCVGEYGFLSGEARSRTEIGLPGNQLELVKAVYEVNPSMVCVLIAGRPLIFPWISDTIPSILMAWQPGTMAGYAIADVLFGDYNPSGKLTMTFPRTLGQVPLYYNEFTTGRPPKNNQKIESGWVDTPITPRYPFGFGLSYTEFTYSAVTLSSTRMRLQDTLQVSVSVKNIGSREGAEVVQLYIRDEVAYLSRPVRELKRFEKITLQPGEEKKVTFELNAYDLAFWHNLHECKAEPGMFEVFVGTNVQDTQSARFELVE